MLAADKGQMYGDIDRMRYLKVSRVLEMVHQSYFHAFTKVMPVENQISNPGIYATD
jgi:hypothetical protein